MSKPWLRFALTSYALTAGIGSRAVWERGDHGLAVVMMVVAFASLTAAHWAMSKLFRTGDDTSG